MNLYGICGNDTVNRFDVLGREEFDPYIPPVVLPTYVVTGADDPTPTNTQPVDPGFTQGVNDVNKTAGRVNPRGPTGGTTTGGRKPTTPGTTVNAAPGAPIANANSYYNALSL